MSGQINATCSICGNGYHLCVSCKDKMKLHPYKIHCCSSSCYKVFQVVKGYSTGVYNKSEFKTRLNNIDLSNLENYKDNIKSLIKDALKEDEVVKVKSIEMIEEPVADFATEEVAERPIYSRKRNYKVNDEVAEAE